jgi:hypothetical protein
MKARLAPAQLATHFHRPLRFGSVFRGWEALLRTGQLILLFWAALAGAKLLAQGVVQGAGMLVGLLS